MGFLGKYLIEIFNELNSIDIELTLLHIDVELSLNNIHIGLTLLNILHFTCHVHTLPPRYSNFLQTLYK